MALDKSRMKMIAQMQRENESYLKEGAGSPDRDRSGSVSNNLAHLLRFVGVADYVVDGNVDSFKANLVDSVTLIARMFERFEDGEPIDRSYVSMLAYTHLFDALAVGNADLTQRLANLLGGRSEIEAEFDHRFDLCFGYVLKAFAVQDDGLVSEWLPKFRTVCNEKDNANFVGYMRMFDGIAARSLEVAQDGLDEITSKHKAESRGSGIFRDSADEFLCVWGIGMARLARLRGLSVGSNSPLVPAELLE